MKTIMITAPASNSGKTLVSLGLIRALKNRGLNIGAFKTGPDFIDTGYLGIASGKRAGNLDMHMMGKEGLFHSLAINLADYALIEGAMGYFDGIYNTYENSGYHISKELDINAVLVYTPEGEMFSIIPKIKGMVEFPGSNIKGLILNKVSRDMYMLLKEKIDEYIGIELLGYVEEDRDLKIGDRYLGLIQSIENEDTEVIIERAAKQMENTLNLDSILGLMRDLDLSPYIYPKRRNVKVALAYDEAFSFYYNENLKLLENSCQLEYFSPLNDDRIPKCDLLYIGGGYPELFKEQLAWNTSMIESIRRMGNLGGYIYGEAGGFMYLTDEIDGFPMVGLLRGKAFTRERFQRFGYTGIELREDTFLGEKGNELVGNESHCSLVDTELSPIYEINRVKSKEGWQCGYIYKNTLGAYPHINFLGNLNAFDHLLNTIENKSPNN